MVINLENNPASKGYMLMSKKVILTCHAPKNLLQIKHGQNKLDELNKKIIHLEYCRGEL